MDGDPRASTAERGRPYGPARCVTTPPFELILVNCRSADQLYQLLAGLPADLSVVVADYAGDRDGMGRTDGGFAVTDRA